MRACLLSYLAVLCIYTSAYAQQRSPAPTDYTSALRQELSSYKNGAWLYERCDLFRHIIDDRLQKRLADELDNAAPAVDMPLATQSDTTLDITRASSEEDEPTIAISRANPKLLVAGMNDNAQFAAGLGMSAIVSTNSGSSWKKYHLPKVSSNGCQAFCDPVLICDDAGMFYYAFIILNTSNHLNDIMLGRSTDGVNWTLSAPVVGNVTPPGPLEDKPAMAVDRDPNSPHHGRVYVAWSRYISLETDSIWDGIAYIAHSDDHGDHWSAPVKFTTTYGSVATVRVGKGGVVFITSSNWINDTAASCAMDVSYDGGDSFSEYPLAKTRNYPVDHNYYVLSMLKGPHGFRSGPYVAFDLDPTNNHLYAVYGNYDTVHGTAQQLAVESSDEGKTWSTPRQIGTAGHLDVDHFTPWVSFDPLLSKPYVTLYSSEEDLANNDSTRYVRCTFDALDRVEKIGTRLFDPRTTTTGTNGAPMAFIGDYTYSDAFGGTFAAVWTENRPPSNHDGDIFAYVSSPSSNAVTREIDRPAFVVGNVTPNPNVSDEAKLLLTSTEAAMATIRVSDLGGREVLHAREILAPNAETTVSLNTRHLAAGVYHLWVEGGQSPVERSFVVLR